MLSIFGVSLVLYFIKILNGSRNLAVLIEKWISFSKLVPVLFSAFRSPGMDGQKCKNTPIHPVNI
jgi:hypothetical protein